MIRAFFFSVGTFVALCGAALVGVDRLVLTDYAAARLRRAVSAAPTDPAADASPWRLHFTAASDAAAGREVIDPPDWAAFALLSAGGVTVLYALALPGRRKDDEEH